MFVEGIRVDDVDSLDAASDLREAYEQYDAQMDIQFHTEIDDDGDDDPTPTGPAAVVLHPDKCRECEGTGIKRYYTGGRLIEWIEVSCKRCLRTGDALLACPACRGTGKEHRVGYEGKDCWYCDGTGADHLTGEETPPSTPIPFDRAAHCRNIASSGGRATVSIHGTHHMRVIGSTGARITVERHGYAFWRGLMNAKGWHAPRQLDFLADIRAGRELAALEREAA